MFSKTAVVIALSMVELAAVIYRPATESGTTLASRRLIAQLPAGGDDSANANGPLRAYFSISGLPQVKYTFDAKYKNGTLIPFSFGGTAAYIIRPTGKLDRQHRWVWLTPMWLALNGDTMVGHVGQRFYVESFLDAGFYVVGIDIGAACASPAAADLYERFYREIVRKKYRLNPKARMLGTSHGGGIEYGWAFRHPNQVDRIVGLAPATDLRSWPGLEKVCGPKRITPEGLAYPLTLEELKARLAEFNPIDNLAPLAKAHVKLLHVHGDNDPLVPMGPNSVELIRRYRLLGGQADLEVLKGLGHGGEPLFHSERAAQFLLE